MKTLRRIINKTKWDRVRNDQDKGIVRDPKHNIMGYKEGELNGANIYREWQTID